MRITSPKNNDTINPAPQINSMLACFVDLLLRIAVIWLSVLSLLLFVSDSFGFTVPLSFLALSAAFCVLFFAGMSAGIIPCLLGLILIGIVTYTTIRSINVLPVLEELWLTVQGVSVEKMLRLGYTLFENYEITSPPILYTKEQYEMTAFFILSFLLSGVFVPSMIRKVRLFPPFFVGFLICLPIFFLNLPDSNWGFALLICALCGILVIKRFETVYFKKNGLIRNKKPFYNSAFASFAGFAVTAIAILTIALPAAKIEEPAPTLDFIDRSVEKFRQRLDNLLSGQNEALPGVSPSLWAPRSTIAQNRKFSDDLVFTIKTFSDTPVYLRGWVGMNYTNDKWELPNQEFISEYKKLFGTSFIPDEITSNFYSFIGSTPAYISDSFIDLSDYGATMQQITISSRADTEYLHVPPVLYGRIFEPFDDYPLIDLQNHNFFDGILINPSKRNTPDYTAYSFVQTMKDPTFIENIEDGVIYLLYMQDRIRYYDDIIRITERKYHEAIGNNLIKQATDFLDRHSISYPAPTLLEIYIYNADSGFRNDITDYLARLDTYHQYAKQFYAQPSGSKLIKDLALEIYSDIPKEKLVSNANLAGDFCTEQHAVVMSVLNYLSENMSYTLSPSNKSNSKYSAIENFLFVTREGYCVQFASAAALLLRDLGIPTRYVEGYIADTFFPDNNRYVSDVYDYNAHAWIEVYYDGYGWLKYEATTIYMEGAYGEPVNPDETTLPETAIPPSTLPSETTNDPLPGVSDTDDPGLVTDVPPQPGFSALSRIIPIILLSALAVLSALLIKRRGDKAFAAKQKFSEDIQKGNFSKNQVTDHARNLSNYIMQLFAAEGLTPFPGELQHKYAARLTEHYGEESVPSLPALFVYLTKAEFSTLIEREELQKINDYYILFRDLIWKRMSLWKRLRYRYLKRMI